MKTRSVVCRLTLAGLAAFSLFLHAAPADAAGKKIALTSFSGWKAEEVRDWVKSAIKDDFTVTDAEDFKPGNNAGAYASLASKLGADAVLVGKQLKGRVSFTLRGKDGAVIKTWEVRATRGPKLQAAIDENVPETLTQALGKSGSAPARAEAAPAAAKDEDSSPKSAEEGSEESAETTEKSEASADEDAEEDSEDEDEPAASSESSENAASGETGAPFVLGFGVRFQNRQLSYNDTLVELAPDRPIPNNANVLQDYSLGLQPVLVLDLGVYPGVFFGAPGFLSNLGLVGGFEYGIPITSKYTGSRAGIPAELKNKTQEWYLGPRVRVPGATNEFGISLVYGKHSFDLDGDADANALIPDTSYSYVRPGADAWFSFGKLFVGADIGALVVMSTGKLEDERYWFRNASGLGIDAGLRFGYELTPLLSLVLGGNITRYGFNFNPIPKTATRVAGGAVDQYISGFVGVRFAFGSGSSRGFGLNSVQVSAAAPSAASAESAAAEESASDADASTSDANESAEE